VHNTYLSFKTELQPISATLKQVAVHIVDPAILNEHQK